MVDEVSEELRRAHLPGRKCLKTGLFRLDNSGACLVSLREYGRGGTFRYVLTLFRPIDISESTKPVTQTHFNDP